MATTNDIQILTLAENSNAHGTEWLIQRLNNSSEVVEVVYTLGDAGGYLGVVDSIAIFEDEDGDFWVEGTTDSGMFYGSKQAAVDVARDLLRDRANPSA